MGLKSALGKVGRGFVTGLKIAQPFAGVAAGFLPGGSAAFGVVNAALKVSGPLDAIINGPSQAEETGLPGTDKMQLVLSAFKESLAATEVIAEASGYTVQGMDALEAQAQELIERSVKASKAFYAEMADIEQKTEALVRQLKIVPKA